MFYRQNGCSFIPGTLPPSLIDLVQARLQEARTRFQAMKLDHSKIKTEREALIAQRNAGRDHAEKLVRGHAPVTRCLPHPSS